MSKASFDAFELFDCKFIKGEPVLLSKLKGTHAAVVELPSFLPILISISSHFLIEFIVVLV
jgi:hypothetical protein